jgi:hypothetical protein
MKIAGASRRSAAPGSQNVGVAEYGDDLCESHRREVSRTKARIHSTHRCMRFAKHPKSVRQSSHARLRARAREAPRSTPSTLVAASKREAANLRLRTQPAPLLSFALSSAAAPHRLRNQSPRATAELSTHRMPPRSETAANPSFNLTHSGLRPPRAS